MRWTRFGLLATGLSAVLITGACASNGATTGASSPAGVATTPSMPPTATNTGTQSVLPSQSPVPAESNPPGDIPDTTVYIPYSSTSGRFGMKVPEGWARATKPASVGFASALNTVTVAWQHSSSAPTVASVRSSEITALKESTLAFSLVSVKSVTLPGGPAVLITYQVNSKPNAVTGKQYRLVVERFEFFDKGTQAIMSLSSAVGSDNVDPWRIVSESFRWA